MSAHSPGAVVLRAQGLRKSFGPARRAVTGLDDVDLTLLPGEVLALLGPNGAGKTTTVRILATLLKPDAGAATVAGLDVVRDAARVREVISLTGQYASVDEKLSAVENLTMMGKLFHLPRHSVGGRVAELIEAVDLGDAASRRVGTFSGGMRRRLDLAAGLLTRPLVMFLDEPTTGLDPRSRQAMWDVIRTVVADGTSLLLTTQYLEEADQLADRISLLDGGRVVAEGTAAELKARVGDAGVELMFASVAEAARAATVLRAALGQGSRALRVPTDGSVNHVRSVLNAIDGAGLVPERWEVRAPSLDDVFLTLTGHAARTTDADGAAA
jgi:ABC-2 type transport system ATP-binding protein